MTTTFETQVYNETIRREGKSKLSWSQQHAEDAPFAPRPVFPLNSQEHARLDKLKNKVADLCDLQPTPVSMLRPPRKVRSRAPLPHIPVARMVRLRSERPELSISYRPRAQQVLKELKKELEEALSEVSTQLDAMGGSEYTMSVKSTATAKSMAKSMKSTATMSTVAE